MDDRAIGLVAVYLYFSGCCMAGKHVLTSYETSAINSILDDEERRVTGAGSISPRMMELDGECRRIWPSWESTPVTRTAQPYQPPRKRSPPPEFEQQAPIPQKVAKPPNDRFDTPTRYQMPSDFTRWQRNEQDYEPVKADLFTNDVDSLKSEMDSLIAKIRTTTRSPTLSPSPPVQSPVRGETPTRMPDYGRRPNPTARDLSFRTEPQKPTDDYELEMPSPAPELEMPSPAPERPTYERTPQSFSREPDYSPASREQSQSSAFGMPETLRLQQENVRLKAELLKAQKRLEAEKEENQKLLMALDKSEQLRAVYKKRLEQYQKGTSSEKE